MPDSLNGLDTGPLVVAPDIVPPLPRLSTLCPKLARIDPDGVAAYEASQQKWAKDLNFRLQNGKPLTG